MRRWKSVCVKILKIKILMGFKFLLIGIFILTSCSNVFNVSSHDEGSNDKTFTVTLTSKIHRPYCGGAYPTQEEEMGFYSISKEKAFYISSDSILSDKNRWRIERNIDTSFTFKIPAGDYFVYHIDKALAIKDFISKHGSSNSNEQMADAKCYENWKNTPDFTFNVSRDEHFEFTYFAKCFTGTNPCISYEGPYPP